jgi:CubicO group peptidase (beta-lactamase class C family)
MTLFEPARLRETAARLLAEHRLPGLSVGVVQGRDLVFAESWGYADIESKTPTSPEHRQRIASITKTMVGLCAMALVDEGRRSLDDLVPELLPDIPFSGHSETLTVRHLLTHTGGIGETPELSQLKDPFRLLFGAPEVSLVEAYRGGVTVEVPPGTKWAYANHGYFLLGEIISRVEGTRLSEVVSRRVFSPLGMKNSDLLDQPNPKLSTGYHRAPDEDARELMRRAGREIPEEATVDGINIRHDFTPEWGGGAAGGVQSTVPDMALYASALLDRGGSIVRPETFEAMVSPVWSPHPLIQAWGLSFAVGRSFGRRSFGHGGNALGWNSNLTVFPDDGIATIIHTNVTCSRFDRVVQHIKQAVLGAPSVSGKESPLSMDLVAGAAGVYEAPTPGPLTNFRMMTEAGRIQLSAREGALSLHSRRGRWKHGFRLAPVDSSHPDVFILDTGDPDPPRVALVRDKAQAVTGLHISDGNPWYLQRTDRVEPWA